MGFYIKRFVNALKTQRNWLSLALIPVLIYLIAAALLDRTVTVTQSLSFSGSVVVAKNPVASIELDALFADPDLLFQEGFALTDLSRKAEILETVNLSAENLTDLRRFIYQSMSLSKTDDSRLRIAYQGSHESLGRSLVAYFSDRLVNRSKDAIDRTQGGSTSKPNIEIGPLTISSRLSLWNPNRLLPAFWVLIVSLSAIMAIIAMREFSDPSFKSERQIARYLGLPVLGALPDAIPLAKRLNH